MILRKSLFVLIIFAVLFTAFKTGKAAQDDLQIRIKAEKKEIKYGEPFVLDIMLEYNEPQISRITNKPAKITDLDEMDLHIKWIDTNETRIIPFRLPVRFTMQDSKGVKYKKKVVIFCDLYDRHEKLVKDIIFDKTGVCTLKIVRSSNKTYSIKSNTIKLTVKPSRPNKKMLTILSEPRNLAFLLGGLYKSPNTVSNLRKVVRGYEETTLAKWCAARLGVEYFKEFQKFRRQNYDSEDFNPRKQDGEGLALFNKARKYLEKGYTLPDDFPIRPEVADNLLNIAYINKNYQKAIQLAEELETKYPHTKYGKKALRAKKELNQKAEKQKDE